MVKSFISQPPYHQLPPPPIPITHISLTYQRVTRVYYLHDDVAALGHAPQLPPHLEITLERCEYNVFFLFQSKNIQIRIK